MRRTIPRILNDVGSDIGEQFQEIFTKPAVSRAMSVLGTKSGEVRHNASAEKALANGILDNVAPELRIILDRIAPDLLENYGPETLLSLYAKYGPLINQMLPNGIGSLGNILPEKKTSNFKSEF